MSTGSDPFTVVQAFNNACNANDIDRAMAFFADDAVITFRPPPPPPDTDTVKGQQEIREWLEPQLQEHLQVTDRNYQVSGDTVTLDATIRGDWLTQMGVDSLELQAEATVVDGKMRSFVVIQTPETRQKLEAAQQES